MAAGFARGVAATGGRFSPERHAHDHTGGPLEKMRETSLEMKKKWLSH
jgi:hypothetical protein